MHNWKKSVDAKRMQVGMMDCFQIIEFSNKAMWCSISLFSGIIDKAISSTMGKRSSETRKQLHNHHRVSTTALYPSYSFCNTNSTWIMCSHGTRIKWANGSHRLVILHTKNSLKVCACVFISVCFICSWVFSLQNTALLAMYLSISTMKRSKIFQCIRWDNVWRYSSIYIPWKPFGVYLWTSGIMFLRVCTIFMYHVCVYINPFFLL